MKKLLVCILFVGAAALVAFIPSTALAGWGWSPRRQHQCRSALSLLWLLRLPAVSLLLLLRLSSIRLLQLSSLWLVRFSIPRILGAPRLAEIALR
jgi:Na+/melibiose symporter-like transporter